MTLKYLFLILSIVVIFVIFYSQYNFGKCQIENMDTNIGNSDNSVAETCSGDYTVSTDLPLKEYCVKSSFNTACSGKDVSEETLLKRIKEGYRFIDLNVFSASGDVYVGFSPDNSPSLTSNKLLLSDALKCIGDNAFSSGTVFESTMSNISKYPVFVHIRVYRPKDSITDIIANVAKTVTGGKTSPPVYSQNYLLDSDRTPLQIDGCTPLSTLMGKMVFSMDILNILEIYAPVNYQSASTIPPETIESLQTFVNILSGGSTFPAFYRYTDDSLVYRTNTLGISNSSIKGSLKTNVKYMYICFPHPNDVSKLVTPINKKATGVIQPDIKSFLLSRSIQFIPLRIYLADANVKTYTDLFDTIGTPFAPMFYVYRTLNN
jgi:hypothetical protein